MDKLDRDILKELVRNNVMPFPSPALRKSFRSIGRKLNVDQGTVRNRMRKFQEKGLLQNFYLGVNPSLFGFRIAALWFDVRPPSEKDNVRRKVSEMEKMLLVCDYLGTKLSAVFCYDSEEELRTTIRQITRKANSEEIFWQDKPFLPCDVSSLTPSDWRIIVSLQRGDAWKKSFSCIARETGLTTKTVKKRVGMMADRGAIYLLARLDLSSFENFIPCDLTITYESPELRAQVNETLMDYLGEMLVFADTQSREQAYFALTVPSVAKIREIQDFAEKAQGVLRARVQVLHGIHSISKFYEERTRTMLGVPIKVAA